MRRETVFVTLFVCITIFAASTFIARGGPLDPPAGPVTPTYKTLNEVEPRIPIGELPFTIQESGSYYLTASLGGSDGIQVNAPNVTLDLMGHSLTRVGGQSPTAIEGSDVATGLTVRNGHLVGWGAGIVVEDTRDITVESVRFDSTDTDAILIADMATIIDCIIRDCGGSGVFVGRDSVIRGVVISDCTSGGLVVGDRSTIAATHVTNAGGIGILTGNDCGLSQCSAQTSGERGVDVGAGCVISDCTSSSNGLDGFAVGDGSLITRSTARANGRDGIQGSSPLGCSIIECVSVENNNFGIDTAGATLIERCTVDLNENGIRAFGTGCRVIGNLVSQSQNNGIIVSSNGGSTVDGNTVLGISKGIWVTGMNNVITRNRVRAVFDYDITDGNAYGPIVDVDGDGDITGTPGADHPLANFIF